jgi:hypothetical protein
LNLNWQAKKSSPIWNGQTPMLPFIAIPLVHSSGVWIASTATGGYVAGTLSTTWIGAFVAGNAGLLSALGITSAAGVFASAGGVMSTAGTALGTGLSTIGLSGLAKGLGLAPATLFGLTFVAWGVVASVTMLIGLVAIYIFAGKKLKEINKHRHEGGLEKTTWKKIVKEARDYEKNAMNKIISQLEKEFPSDFLRHDEDIVHIKGITYSVGDLKYVVKKDGAEMLVKRSRIPFRCVIVFIVRLPAINLILLELEKELPKVVMSSDKESVCINDVNYMISDLKYVVKKNGAEVIVKKRWIPFRNIIILTVKISRRK